MDRLEVYNCHVNSLIVFVSHVIVKIVLSLYRLVVLKGHILFMARDLTNYNAGVV